MVTKAIEFAHLSWLTDADELPNLLPLPRGRRSLMAGAEVRSSRSAVYGRTELEASPCASLRVDRETYIYGNA